MLKPIMSILNRHSENERKDLPLQDFRLLTNPVNMS